MRNHLQDFKKGLSFDSFDENGIADYIDYLGKTKKMKNSTINKQLSFLRWFLRWSYEKGYNHNHTFEYFKPKLKSVPKKVIFLNQEELQKIVDFQIPTITQHWVLFVTFSYFVVTQVFAIRMCLT